jgi:hypothetical protein
MEEVSPTAAIEIRHSPMFSYPKVVKPMAETKTQRRPAAKTKRRPAASKATSARKASSARKPRAARGRDARIEQTRELSDDLLKSLDRGAQSAIDAVRKFTETADRVLPPHGDGPTRREELTDSALEMAQKLVHTQAEFLRSVIDSAGKSLTRSRDGK